MAPMPALVAPLLLLFVVLRSASPSPILDLTDATFDSTISSSDSTFLVAFVAPWCGYCKKLTPEFAEAAQLLDGADVILSRVDGTENEKLANRFGVSGYPTLKTFKGGNPTNPKDYNGEREAGPIANYMQSLAGPPAVPEITQQAAFDAKCGSAGRVCLIVFLPHILDSTASGREKEIEGLREIANDLFGARVSVLWAEGGKQDKIERACDVAESYPTAAVVSVGKGVAAPYRGTWDLKKLKK